MSSGEEAATKPSAHESGDRGRLDIGGAVLRKIAEYAADTAEGTVRTPRRIAGVGLGAQGSSARVHRQSGRVRIALDVALQYPSSVRAAATTIRERVGTEITRITGNEVSTVDVTVSALLPEQSGARVE